MITKKVRTIGPYSSSVTLAKLDGRTRKAALMRRVREELSAHVGGKPNAPQRLLIERCAMLNLRLSLLDHKIALGQDFTLPDTNYYIAWSNALARTLAQLGIQSPQLEAKAPTLRDLFPPNQQAVA